MNTPSFLFVEFQCQKCAIWYPSLVPLTLDSVKLLDGVKMRCPCCNECFTFHEESVRFCDIHDAYAPVQANYLKTHK